MASPRPFSGGAWLDPVPSPLLLSASPNGRYLVGADGTPFFVNGEAAWSAIVNLDATDQATYLDDCQARGFNTVMVNLIEHEFTGNSPAWRNENGDLPFSGTAFQSSTVTDYFDAALAFVRLAAARGIVVFLAPCYLGYDGGSQGWQSEIEAASAGQAQSWGAFVGALFKNEPNIVWQMYGDYNPPSHARTNSVQAGIASVDTVHTLYTSHFAPNVSSHEDADSWLTLDYIYRSSSGYTHDDTLDGWNEATTRPLVMGESTYELENSASTLDIRRQAWGACLSGAGGHFYGHRDIWGFGDGLFQVGTWQAALDDTGRVQMGYLQAFFTAREWHLLEPAQGSTLITAGRGTLASTSYVTCALASDASWAAAYLPTGSSGGAITVDRTEFSGAFSWFWFNPRTGGTSAGANGVANTGTQNYTAPDGNDWVWIAEVD